MNPTLQNGKHPHVDPVPQSVPSRAGAAARCWIGNLLMLIAFLGLISEGLIRQADLGMILTILLSAAAGIAVIAVGLFGRKLAMTGRKQRAAIAAHTRAADQRPPVLYLRSFTDDKVVADANVVKGFIQLSTEEEQFAKVLDPIGPFVAIGDPREKLPTLGATRHYVADDKWRQDVEQMLARARLVVLRLSTTKGLVWELQHVFTELDPGRILLLIPGTDKYEVFRNVAALWLPKPLPDLPRKQTKIGSLRGIVRFRSDWSPEFLLVKFSILRASLRSPIAPHLKTMLRPVFEQSGTPWKKPPLGVFSIGMMSFLGLGLLFTMLLLISNS